MQTPPPPPPTIRHIKKVLVANRGEIAVRCIRTCRKLDLATVAVFTEPDATSMHVALADEQALLSSYTDVDEILRLCSSHAADAVFPGYGFLSENAAFARRVRDAGLAFVGPSAESIEAMGEKHQARLLAARAGVPVVPGSGGLLESSEAAVEESRRLGFPVIVKATAGGGGMGLLVCHDEKEVVDAFERVRSRGETMFGNAGLFVEKYFPRSRHIEVQVFGNGSDAVHFGERECSIQRRHQKVIEECPSPFVTAHPGLRAQLTSLATKLTKSIRYASAGTIEYLVDERTASFYFLEMNTRLQVEHGITELCYGVDLVELMLLQADCEFETSHSPEARSGGGGGGGGRGGGRGGGGGGGGGGGIPMEYLMGLQKEEEEGPEGAAIEVRLCAENPAAGFVPCPGTLQRVHWADAGKREGEADAGVRESVRVDTWVKTGQVVSPLYDPLLAKIIVHSTTSRASSISLLLSVLAETKVQGVPTNQHFLAQIIDSAPFRRGETPTSFLRDTFTYAPCGIDVLAPGAYTTVQDTIGRVGAGHGIPRSGAMDEISAQISNLLVSNPPETEVLEITLSGPTLLFRTPAVVAVCGASMPVGVDGVPTPMWARFVLRAGQRLEIGAVDAAGCRAYLAVRGGFPEIPLYIGSKSTTPSLKLGGLQGRQLLAGDYLSLSPSSCASASSTTPYTLPPSLHPAINATFLPVLPGPHDSADLISPSFRTTLYASPWKIGHNSSRSGVRLLGPAPVWARTNGGAGGAHPSNVVDYGYPSPGGINWTGDAPVVFANDSPGLGGFVCSCTVVAAGLWRLGQVRPGEEVLLRRVGWETATEMRRMWRAYLAALGEFLEGRAGEEEEVRVPNEEEGMVEEDSEAVLLRVPAEGERPRVVYRQGGDAFIIVEFGDGGADVMMTARIRLLAERLSKELGEVILHPNVSSITIEYDSLRTSQSTLLTRLHALERALPPTPLTKIPCRRITLPLLPDAPALRTSISRYASTTRSHASYLPDNVAHVQLANGLPTRASVFAALLSTTFLVPAVGFLTGLPLLLPLNPTSRLVAQKYNPTRVSTPAGAVGLGGACFAVYPADAQPGGYMLLAQTLPAWDAFGTKPGFAPARPWLFEPFDLVTFRAVAAAEYARLRNEFDAGRYRWDLRDEGEVFDLGAYWEEVVCGTERSAEVAQFRRRQETAAAEMAALEARMYAEWMRERERAAEERASVVSGLERAAEVLPLTARINANVWKVLVSEGDRLRKGQTVAVLEAMKMELPVCVEGEEFEGAEVVAVASEPGSIVQPGDTLVLVRKAEGGS